MGKLQKEALRKLVHLMGLPLVVIYSSIRFHFTEQVGLIFLVVLLLFLLEVEHIRLEYRPKLPKFLNLFRKKEQHHVAGWIFFVTAMIIVFATFDYKIALSALMMTVFGDMAASLMGISFGKKKLFRKKTYVGFFSGLTANLIAGWWIMPEAYVVFVVMAGVASVVELFTNRLDDNLTVPLFSAFTGQVVAFYWGLLA